MSPILWCHISVLFILFKILISIIQMPRNYYTFPYTVKNRFTGMFLVIAEGRAFIIQLLLHPQTCGNRLQSNRNVRRILRTLMDGSRGVLPPPSHQCESVCPHVTGGTPCSGFTAHTVNWQVSISNQILGIRQNRGWLSWPYTQLWKAHF